MTSARRIRIPRRHLIAAILLLALVLGIRSLLLSPLEYDEIWTLEKFAGLDSWRILNDLALPNNHPLNTLFVKFWSGFVTVPQLIRLHSLVFGVLSVALAGVLARGLFHSRRTALWCMVFMALSAPAIGYAGRARGYALQLGFLLLFACGMVWGERRLRRFLPRGLPEAAVISGAVGAVLSVPSAPIFLAASALPALWLYRRRPWIWSMFAALAVAALLSGGYLAANYRELRTAQQWGRELVSAGDWAEFLAGTLAAFVPYALIPFIAIAAATDRKRSAALFAFAVLALASAALFKGGPVRVYLPLAAVVALLAGRGTERLVSLARPSRIRALAPLLGVLALAAGVGGFVRLSHKWSVADYWRWFEAASAEPGSVLVVYPATEGYPLCWNNQAKIFADYRARLANVSAADREMLMFSPSGVVNGMDASNAERELPLPAPGVRCVVGGREAHRYVLHRVDHPGAGAAVVAVPPLPVNQADMIVRQFRMDAAGFLRLNVFFDQPVEDDHGVAVRTGLFFVPAASVVDWARVRDCGGVVYAFAAPASKPVEKVLP